MSSSIQMPPPMTPEATEPAILDGFLLNTRLRCNLTFLSLALFKYEALRRAGNMRTRFWCVPEDPEAFSIPAFDAYEYQVSVKPRSAIWGWIFVGSPGASYAIQARETCTNVPFLSETVSMDTNAGGSLLPGQGKQNMLSRLLIVPEPGLIHVEICSLADETTDGVQLIFCGGEPV